MSRLGIRGRLFLVVVATVGVAVAALVLGFNLILANTLTRESRDLARTRASAQLALLTTAHGRVTVREAPDAAAADASTIWVFSRGAALERPRSGASIFARRAPWQAEVLTTPTFLQLTSGFTQPRSFRAGAVSERSSPASLSPPMSRHAGSR